MFFPLFIALLIIILSFLVLSKAKSGKHPRPPGPKGLPFIGNLHQYASSTHHLYFWKLAKKYGNIFSLKLGSKTLVVISSSSLAKEVTKTQDLAFCSRPSFLGQQKLAYNGVDIAFSPYNDHWREIRKICVVHLFNLKKVQSSRPIREDEVLRMIKKISQQAATSQVTNLSKLLITLTSTIICRVAFGIRYDEEARERRRFNEVLAVTEEMFTYFFFSDYFPLLGWFDKLLGNIARLEKNFKDLDEFYEELIEQHLNPNRPKSMQGDIIDLLLQLKADKSTTIDLTLDHIKAILKNIVVGGTDSSAATMIWAMTALIKNPKAMKKVQEEIRESVGKKAMVNEDDIHNFPYFKAVIKETFRLHPPDPLLIPRETIEKSILEGYEIHPGTIVQVSPWAIGRDSKIWENPEEFIPERFLNSDIDYKGQDFELIPFGAGRRGCPGISIGVSTVELVLSNLLYAFDWELPRGMKIQDIDEDVLPGLTMHKKNALCLVPGNYL